MQVINIREYVYLNNEPLAQVTAGSPETVVYLHTDQLGTPRFATNAAGTQVWAWANDAFGISTPTGSATVNLRMPGQYYDSESSLFYNWNRYYNPAIGRYISSDPIGLAGGLNTFGYVHQNPVNRIDPNGLLGTITYDDGTTVEFLTGAELNNLLSTSLKITNISFYGHGNCKLQAISDQPSGSITEGIELDTSDNSVWLVGNSNRIDELKNLLKGKLTDTATINLRGCNVDAPCDSGGQNITQALSNAIPQAIVSGSPFPTIRFPIFPTDPMIFYDNQYQGGQLLSE